MRTRLFFNLFLLLLTSNFCKGQAMFFKKYGSSAGNRVVKTSDSCYVVSGFGGLNATSLLKINNWGDSLWTAVYNGVSPLTDIDVHETKDGGYVFVGSVNNSFANDALLVKVDSVGNILWNKKIGRTNGNFYDQFTRVFQTYDCGYILEGTSLDITPITGTSAKYIIKTDSSGAVLWTKLYNGIQANYHSGNLTSDSGYVFTGSSIFGNHGIIFIKIDSLGNILFNKDYGIYGDYSRQVGQTLDGGYVILGGNGANNTKLIKADNFGNVQWAKKYANPTYGFDGYSVIQTNDLGFALIGNTNSGLIPSKIICIKTDSLGNVMWSKSYSGYGCSITQANDNGYVITGSPSNLIIKTNELGNSGCFDSTFFVTDSTFQLTVNNFGVSTSSDYVVSTVSLSRGYLDTVITECFTTGLNEIYSEEKIIAFPNPTSNFIYFNQENFTAEIFDLTGRKLLHQKIKDKQLNIINFASGVYFLKVITMNIGNNDAVQTFKIIKQ